jgi:hypothetical protein
MPLAARRSSMHLRCAHAQAVRVRADCKYYWTDSLRDFLQYETELANKVDPLPTRHPITDRTPGTASTLPTG